MTVILKAFWKESYRLYGVGQNLLVQVQPDCFMRNVQGLSNFCQALPEIHFESVVNVPVKGIPVQLFVYWPGKNAFFIRMRGYRIEALLL